MKKLTLVDCPTTKIIFFRILSFCMSDLYKKRKKKNIIKRFPNNIENLVILTRFVHHGNFQK